MIGTNNFIHSIEQNSYVKKTQTKKMTPSRNTHSISFLVPQILTQQQCICMGTAIEHVLKDYICANTSFTDLGSSTCIGRKQMDHLLVDDTRKIIVYAEIKSNLYLDTEKRKATLDKCITITDLLNKKYVDYTVLWCLVNTRYLYRDCIPVNIRRMYNDVDNLVGVNEYINMFGLKSPAQNETDWSSILGYLANHMFTR